MLADLASPCTMVNIWSFLRRQSIARAAILSRPWPSVARHGRQLYFPSIQVPITPLLLQSSFDSSVSSVVSPEHGVQSREPRQSRTRLTVTHAAGSLARQPSHANDKEIESGIK